MSEFGHVHASGPGFQMDAWGVGPFVISDGKRSWRFEDSDRFGPYLINKRGEALDRQPGERHAFWRPHRIWVRQGRRLEPDGIICIWDEPAPTTYWQIGSKRKFRMIVEPGDEDGALIEVPQPTTGKWTVSPPRQDEVGR